jgi:hypothetical protein
MVILGQAVGELVGGGPKAVPGMQCAPQPPHCCPYPCPYCTLALSALPPSLLLPLPVSVLYTPSLPP